MNKGQTPFATDEIPVEEQTIATAQEAGPLPYLAGTRMIAILWIDEALDMKAVQTGESIGKK